MKFGIITEGKNPPDKRVPFTPAHCKKLLQDYPTLAIAVQSSAVRAYTDEEYRDAGISVVENLDDCDVIWGVKEVNIEDLIPGKTFFFFSHTYKEQPYNRNLLKAIIAKNIRLIDYELLTNQKGQRVVAFGRYAGIVGAYNGLRAYAELSKAFTLPPAHSCFDLAAMNAQLRHVSLPANYKIAITGKGRVSNGAQETLRHASIREVSPEDYCTKSFNEPVFTVLGVDHYNKRKDGAPYNRTEFFNNPEDFVSDFQRFAAVTDLYIPCHYWDAKAPYIFTRAAAKSDDFKISIIADVSCDIDGPVASTLRPSTIAEPFYGYDPKTEKEVPFGTPGSIAVMAVDNLPCELPRNASTDFGDDLIEHVVPALFDADATAMLWRATETKNGELTPHFNYLKNYIA
ncbi:MAG: NAD(P)-dependent oxidoreductase [Schleiferiaceae bacterium]|nr:NAD(P)-dependent oxidoreductase [Schleiferiaceae bacterium]